MFLHVHKMSVNGLNIMKINNLSIDISMVGTLNPESHF